MSTFTDTHKVGQPSLDGPNDLQPAVKTSRIIAAETPVPAKVKKTKTTTKAVSYTHLTLPTILLV